jgi:O-acetyl-ADP-ribose deacetylase (regulator of RNase III)
MEDVRSIAFCLIAPGAYRFPLDQAVGIALNVARSFEESDLLELARFSLYTEKEFTEFGRKAKVLVRKPHSQNSSI